MKKQIKVAYFPSTATKSLVLSSNGKSLDKYCVSCSTEEDLSTGNYILDATFLIEDNLQDLLQEEVILKVLMDYGDEIFRISKPTVGTRYINIVARQITIADALTLWLEDVRPTTMSGTVAGSYMVSNATGVKEIQVVSDIPNIATAYYPKLNLYEALHDCDQSFLNRWGGEILRRGYIENINSHIGIDRGFAIREGKNLVGFECSSNIDNLITRAQGKGFNGIVGNYIDSPLIGAYNRVYTNIIEYPGVKVNDENTTDGYDTLELAQAELDRLIELEYSQNGIDKIKAAYVVNFVQLEKTEEYKNYVIAERVYLGDTLRVYIPRLNTDIQVRAISKIYDILAQKTKEIKLSNYIENKTLTLKQITEFLESMDSTESVLQQAKDNASLLIKAGLKNSYVTVRENEIIIGDTKDINTMTNVWRWNNGGLGFSSDGYYGTFGTAITSDGHMVADFIDTGVLNADIIKTGTITSKNGKFSININGDSATFGSVPGHQLIVNSDGSLVTPEIEVNKLTATDGSDTLYISAGLMYFTSILYGFNADMTKAVAMFPQAGMVKATVVQAWNDNGDYTAPNGTLALGKIQTLECHDAQIGDGSTGSGAAVIGWLTVTGSKNSLQTTENYGDRLINAYETAEYYFGDIGYGTINNDGECFVAIDEIFQECVNINLPYHVFTQAYIGSITSIDRQVGHFIVKGEIGTEFSWELKAKRLGYELKRMEIQDITQEDKETITEPELGYN